MRTHLNRFILAQSTNSCNFLFLGCMFPYVIGEQRYVVGVGYGVAFNIRGVKMISIRVLF